MYALAEKARAFAIEAHGSQKYGDQPYIIHLDAVAAIVTNYGDVALTIAYLHDVLEDTLTSVEDIRELFGNGIAEAVTLLTDEPGINRKERKTKTNFKLSQASGYLNPALTVKAADRLANVRGGKLNDMYRKEHGEFRNAVWRSGIAIEIWQELDSILGTAPTEK